MKIGIPETMDSSKYYTRYLSLASGDDLLAELSNISCLTLGELDKLQDADLQFAYAENKWSIGILLQHICDAERVYAYRSLRFLRGDTREVPGFDEDFFAQGSLGYKTVSHFVEEYTAVRSATVHLFLNSNLDNLDLKGNANGMQFTPRELGWLAVGHNRHHLNILEERYLPRLK